jgi:nitrite reductase (NADH) small subunit
MPQIRAGHIDDVPEAGCVAAAGGRVLLVRHRGGIVAFDNHCLHTGGQLDGATVRGGVLMCARHFWRYRVDDGRLISGGLGCLPRYPVHIDDDGAIHVDLPEPPHGTLREQLLDHARTWNRGD